MNAHTLDTLYRRAFIRAVISTVGFAVAMIVLLVSTGNASAETIVVRGINNMNVQQPSLNVSAGIPQVIEFIEAASRGYNPKEGRIATNGAPYTHADMVCFLAEIYKLDLQAAPAMQTGGLQSLIPSAYDDLRRHSGLQDVQMIGLWNDYGDAARDDWRAGSAIIYSMLTFVSAQRSQDARYKLAK